MALCRVVWQWRPHTPRLMKVMPMHIPPTGMAQIGPLIFVGLLHQGVDVYNEEGQCVASWRPAPKSPEYVDAAALAASLTGELVVLDLHDRCIKVFRTDGTLVRVLGRDHLRGSLTALTVTPQGQIVVAGEQLFVFRWADGQCVHRWSLQNLGHIGGLCMAPDGLGVMCANWDSDCIDVYRLCDGTLVRRWKTKGVKSNASLSALELPSQVRVWQNRLFVVDLLHIRMFRLHDTQPLLVWNAVEMCGIEYPHHVLVTAQNRLWVLGNSSAAICDMRLSL